MSLIDPTFLENVGSVLTEGAEEYGDYNWKECDDASKFVDAALRHLARIMSGELIDPDSGKPHAAHLACNAMFLHHMALRGSDLAEAKSEVDEILTSTLERDMREVLEFQKKDIATTKYGGIKPDLVYAPGVLTSNTMYDQNVPPGTGVQVEVYIGYTSYQGSFSSTREFWSSGRKLDLPSEYTWRVVV